VSLHTLRHSYATHFLEDTGDVFSLKENLGHAMIDTTLLYVHIVGALPRWGAYSPMARLFEQAKNKS
jgi:site-specific recombinase XerC